MLFSAAELHEKYGGILQEEARDAPTAYKLQKVLANRLGIHVTEASLKTWFAKYFQSDTYVKIVTASRLELEYGAKIRGCSDLPTYIKEL